MFDCIGIGCSIALKLTRHSHFTELELLDSRWNGNEVFKYTTDKGLFFIKLNRVEDPSVFLTEAVGLSAIAATETITCPKPLHLGRLPKVGDVGPGAFMVLEHLKLMPFGIMRSDMQRCVRARACVGGTGPVGHACVRIVHLGNQQRVTITITGGWASSWRRSTSVTRMRAYTRAASASPSPTSWR